MPAVLYAPWLNPDFTLDDLREIPDFVPQYPDLVQVPPGFRQLLSKGFGILHNVHDEALSMSVLRRTSPFIYHDPVRYNKTLFVCPTPELIEHELEKMAKYSCGEWQKYFWRNHVINW